MSNVNSLFVGLRQIGRRPVTTSGFAGAGGRPVLTALAAVACFFLSALVATSPAAAACPNEVFRSGPSAKLPDCRAYELVTPEYTAGVKPTATNFSNFPHGFEFPLITAAGDSVSFNTVGGALVGTPGSGFSDRYRAIRTAGGWVTKFVGPTTEETERPAPGAVAPDHDLFFFNAGLNEFNLEPEGSLQAPFGGRQADYLRLANGENELIGLGSLGFSREADGRLITADDRVVFSAATQLEPEASPDGKPSVYERTPGGPTHVLSLLPDGSAPAEGANYLGASADANDVAFQVGDGSSGRWYVRRNKSVTKEVARSNGVVAGKELICAGLGSPTLDYQWLRNGAPIGGANAGTYTPTGADAGAALQCLVEATGAEGGSLAASQPPILVAPFSGKDTPILTGLTLVDTGGTGFVSVGETVSCQPGSWEGDPTFAYQWLRDGVEIAGATGSTYDVGAADEGESLQCRVTASNGDGTVLSFSPFVPVRPALPTVSGEGVKISNSTDPGVAPELGDELSCAPGTWSESPTFAYQWLRNGAPIGGANAGTYTVTAADQGAALQCLVTAGTPGGAVRATSNRLVADPQPATAPPESTGSTPGLIFGLPQTEVGDNLNCYGGAWSGEPTISYQWLRDGAEIPGATAENHQVTTDDIGSVIQCLVTASNAGGATSSTFAGTGTTGPRFATSDVPTASAGVPTAGLVFAGIFGGHLFYGDRSAPAFQYQAPGDLYSYDLAGGTTTAITDTGDAQFSHVSRDGSHVYFLSESEIGGEGTSGATNLYVWSRADDSTTYIAAAEPGDAVVKRESQGEYGANLASWAMAMHPAKESVHGLANSYTRSTPDGSVFLFMTTAQLTSFDNIEATPEDCMDPNISGERCPELYRYETATEDLTCISCPPGGTGPATGRAYTHEWGIVTNLNPPNNLSEDGSMVTFETTEGLLPQDGNERRDVYRWKKGEGLALISTGQEVTDSYIYGVTPNGSDIAFLTTQKLLPQDENGGTERIYDARVNGGFPPPEDTVTEPCSGDACQGNPSAAPEAPGIPSASLNGAGNVKPKLKCPKGKRKVIRKGKERCVKRNKGKKQRRNKDTGRKAGDKQGSNR
ncbi:MAG TPA: hypothetical protein VFZ19_02130 [Solirubrobacterales bacterium]